VVVVSADATNEPAAVTAARKEAQRWNAVESFCKPFDLDDPDQALTGIAFLIVCDMLLTGFDAPVEQVMYIDKRLSEKLEKLIQEHKEQWEILAEGYEQLRREAMEGRTEAIAGLSKEATTFYEHVAELAFDDGQVSDEHQ